LCIDFDTLEAMKEIKFLGDSRERLRDFPENARVRCGYELREVQKGNAPTDWKPMKTVGPGVREIRIRLPSGAFRVIYAAHCPSTCLCCTPSRKRPNRRHKKTLIWPRNGSRNGAWNNES
jgi:putative component of toxin-antitoxin plasmid stabilization module